MGRPLWPFAHRNVLAHFAGQPYDYIATRRSSSERVGATLIESREMLRRQMHEALDAVPHFSLEGLCEHVRMGRVTGRALLLQATRHTAEHAGEARLIRQLVLAH